MASRAFSKTLRGPLARQFAAVPVQQRAAYSVARSALRAAVAAPRAIAGVQQQQIRGLKTIDFAGHPEDVYGA